MDDAKRFLRYVIPGLVLLTLVFFYSWLLCPKSTWANLSRPQSSVGPALTVLVGAGGVGYLVQLLHHFLRWALYVRLEKTGPVAGLFFDMRQTCQYAVEHEWLVVRELGHSDPLKPRQLDWLPGVARLDTVVWETSAAADSILQFSAARVLGWWDLVHATGAVLVSAVLAFPLALLCVRTMTEDEKVTPCLVLLAIILWVATIIIGLRNYRLVVETVGVMTYTMQLGSLEREYKRKGNVGLEVTAQNVLRPENGRGRYRRAVESWWSFWDRLHG